jgi:7,8-dihydroneopterin aldolase/epimerase/oxygenase
LYHFFVPNQDQICLKGMRFHTLVGLLPHESEVAQPLELDLTVWLSLSRVGLTDSPSNLLDYRNLYEIVADTVGNSPHRLLEGLCEKIAARVMELESIAAVEVAARKPHVPIPGPLDHVEVVIRRTREN